MGVCVGSYNPYDGPNDNPEVELPLTAGEYIYVYGDMDDDGFYEGAWSSTLISRLGLTNAIEGFRIYIYIYIYFEG